MKKTEFAARQWRGPLVAWMKKGTMVLKVLNQCWEELSGTLRSDTSQMAMVTGSKNGSAKYFNVHACNLLFPFSPP